MSTPLTIQTYPAFSELEDEVKQEFYEDVQSSIEDINACVAQLETGADKEIIDRMYRALHTVKGNCNMVFLDAFVQATHRLEDLFSAIRANEIEYDDSFGQFAIVIVNAVNNKLDELMATDSVETDELGAIESIIETVQNDTEDRIATVKKATIAIADGHFNPDLVAVDSGNNEGFSFFQATDIEFFYYLLERGGGARAEEKLFISAAVPLATRINEMLKHKVDEQQLEAALLIAALSFAWSGRQYADESEFSIEQIFFTAGILGRMKGWQVASDLVLQIGEKHDGTGFPKSLAGDDIHPAAQLLALSIEFARLIVREQSTGYKGSLFAAVKAINARQNSTYKNRLISRFNHIIKSHYLTEPQW